MKKFAGFFIIGLIVGLYTTFVIQNLWNWFVVPGFHISEFSFWEIYGLLLLVWLLTERSDFVDEQRWKTAFTALEACVPEGKQQAFQETLKNQTEMVWYELGLKVFGQLVGNTITLAIGWGLHTLLA